MAILAFPGKLTGLTPGSSAVMAEKHGLWLARDRCGAETRRSKYVHNGTSRIG